MRYHSTRNSQVYVQASDAVLQGLAADGGLFVPETLPQIDFSDWLGLTYQDMAKRIFKIFFSDLSREIISEMTDKSYGSNFDHQDIVPTRWIDDKTGFLELWHGPTLAFKDLALQFLPNLMQAAKKQSRCKEKNLILTATSGDTGKAAMEGFADVSGFQVIVFYPYQGISSFQKRQMLSRKAKNVRAVAVRGNFDTCQQGVKALFADKTFCQKMSDAGYRLSSANSINIGRLIPQIIYYIFSYIQAVKKGQISYGEALHVVVPTGNFGNILAACYSKEMGLPLGEIQLAANQNNVLSNFLCTGVYDANRDLMKTSSPSMDILIASNMERYLYLQNSDSCRIAEIMKELADKKKFTFPTNLLNIKADWADEEETSAAIAEVYRRCDYVIDPHTAVAYAVFKKLGAPEKTLIAATASPYKFIAKILHALQVDMPADDWQAIQKMAWLIHKTNPNIPMTIKKTWQIEPEPERVIEPENMRQFVQSEMEKAMYS